MRIKALVITALVLAAGPLAAKPAKPPLPLAPQAIVVGQVLNDTLGKTVNGWLHASGSMFGTAETKGEVTTTRLDCCIAVFSKGRSYIVALTEPVARNSAGGVIKEKVVALKRIEARPGEVQEECSLFNLNLGLTLRNPKTMMARSVVIDNGGFAVLEWKDTFRNCGSDGL
jgi:hypothetical protein